MPFSTRVTQLFELSERTAFGVDGNVIEARQTVMRIVNADRHTGQKYHVSANLSGVELLLAPLSVSFPGALMFFACDNPVDLHLNTSNAQAISGVRQLCMAGTVSGIWIDTGSAVTRMTIDVIGGSAAVVTASVPMP